MKAVKRYWLSAASIVTAAVIAACSGNGSGVTPSTSVGSGLSPMGSSQGQASIDGKQKKRGKARLIIQIPRKPLTLTPLPLPKLQGHSRPKYVSPSTQSMTVSIQDFPSQTFNLTPSSSNCATDPTNGYLTCQESLTSPTGPQTLTVTLYDQTNGQGNQLATATASITVAQEGFTNVPITLGGIVATAAVLINGTAAASVPNGTPTSLPVSVEAYDADGNLIIQPGNYSSPITLTNSDQSGITSFTGPTPSMRRNLDKLQTLMSNVHSARVVSVKGRTIKPFDVTTIEAPGITVPLYYNGDPLTMVTITASVNGTPQSSDATLSGTGAIFTEYPIPTSGSTPFSIAAGSDGALWFTEGCGNKIGRISTDGTIIEYPIPTSGSYPGYITAGPDDALWFTECSGNKIGRISTGGTITEYPVPTSGSEPLGIASGSDGALWFTEFKGNNIGRITTSGTITEYSVPATGNRPSNITTGPDGALWFTENDEGLGNNIVRITTSGAFTVYLATPDELGVHGITTGPDYALWFTEVESPDIGRITTGGAISVYGSFGGTYQITTGSDDALWFTQYGSNAIGRITTSGALTDYSIPTSGSDSYGITKGPDGALWFTECLGNKIGRLQ